jgi:hypothetical protein
MSVLKFKRAQIYKKKCIFISENEIFFGEILEGLEW